MGYVLEYAPWHARCDRYGYVQQHRLVAEHYLGRLLSGVEVVHHEDKDKMNNSPENLLIFPDHSAHMRHHKENSIRYQDHLIDRLCVYSEDSNLSQKDAARLLGISLATVIAMIRENNIDWKSAVVRELSEQSVREALRGRSTLEAAKYLGVHHMTLRNRFDHLLKKRASPGSLNAHKEEIRNLAKQKRAHEIARIFQVNPETVKCHIRRWAKEEPDEWLEILAFQRSRLGIQWSRKRKA